MKKAGRNISSLLTALMVAAPDSNQDNKIPAVGATPLASRGTWYAAPWVWVVGAAVFVLILAIIDKGRGRRIH